MIIKLLLRAILILSSLIVFLLLTSFWGIWTTIRPPKIVSSLTPLDQGLLYEDVEFVTSDHFTLRGWFIPCPKSTRAKTLILLHGYPADKGDILPSLAFLNQKYHLFLFDFRYFGQSEGAYSTVGPKEIEDLLAALSFLQLRGIKELGVYGFSMGGAVALMTASETPAIKAIVAESSYARLDLMAQQLYRLPVLKYPLAYLTRIGAKIFLGLDLKNISPVERVKNLNIPILLVHSINDEVIPFAHALLLQEALKNNPQAEFWFQNNLIHGQFSKEYQKRLEDFFDKHL